MVTAPYRVLLADDSEDMRDLMRRALERTGRFAVVGEAADGRQAIAAAERESPDLVLLDLAMPVMDGLAALPRVRRAAPTATVIVLSGVDAERMAPLVHAKGASAFMPKALGATRVVEQLVAMLDGRLVGSQSSGGLQAVITLAPEPASARRARQFINATLQEWRCSDLVEIVALLTSELVTNAVLHAGTEVDLSLRHGGDVIQIAVADRSSSPPVIKDPPAEAAGGRGMVLLDAMAATWSVVPTEAGKVVWFEVPATPPA